MDEKERTLEEKNTPLHNTKLTWEMPKLFSLDKMKTEGGNGLDPTEDYIYES
ncbi:MAG: hypothetical protein V2I54_02525 [Bacteroidales bacterium]|jgi:hypothetical protein|nr:hypothetical protein [Bacteroidales bacterium]